MNWKTIFKLRDRPASYQSCNQTIRVKCFMIIKHTKRRTGLYEKQSFGILTAL